MNIIMKDGLVDLVMHLNRNCVVMGSSLGLDKINFIFAHFSFWHECERVRETLYGGVANGS